MHSANSATHSGPKARSTWLSDSSMRVREALFAATNEGKQQTVGVVVVRVRREAGYGRMT